MPRATHLLERVLPSGRMQIVLNLAQDRCHGVSRTGERFIQEPALIVGLQRQWQLIDSADMEEMAGILFAPGGLRRFFAEPAHLFSFAETGASGVLGPAIQNLRERLREQTTVEARFAVLEAFLLARMENRRAIHPAVSTALETMRHKAETGTVAEMAQATGWSTRRLNDLFRQEIGVGMKLFCRIQRFQRAIQRLHRGEEVPWPELALSCGYFDQSHFANDFREFSGINPTTYLRSERPWANHLTLHEFF